MKKVATTSILAFSLAVGGCASNGGLASASTNGCSTGMSTAAGALAGALAGYVISQKNGNSSAQNNRAIALGALALTHQGQAFKTLLLDSRVELRRVTWPSKQETTTYTWQVTVVTAILALLVWVMDLVFSELIRFVIG